MTDQIRAAATIILTRQTQDGPAVLMGQRGAGAAFMPTKYVFPGGAVDPEDHAAPATGMLARQCAERLAMLCNPDAPRPEALVRAALREMEEETGLRLAPTPGAPTPGAPTPAAPTPAALRFVFRAITPPGRPRRFDARFFLMDATALGPGADDFARASGELSHLHWIGLGPARRLDLPFITEVVLAEVDALLGGHEQPGVPFFDNSTDVPAFRRIG
ncbi:MAG: NUDIX hydrolase [Tabrizicola sp.]|nr:NUDIX hydrolase [Paracoccaceae bacterium]MDZ4065984.1 NUDIX hydrolase [Tabrizicola sp.]